VSIETALSPLARAERLLAECRTAQVALELASVAEVARVYARQMKLGTHAENHASGIKLKAEIRLAQLVDQGQRRGKIARHGGDRSKARSASLETLEDLGVDRGRLAEARTIATVFSLADIDDVVDEANSEDRAMSRRALLIAARKSSTPRSPSRSEAVRESDRLRQERHRRHERVRPARVLSEAAWDSYALGERALIHTGRLRRTVRKFPRFIGDLDAAEELIRQLAWGPE